MNTSKLKVPVLLLCVTTPLVCAQHRDGSENASLVSLPDYIVHSEHVANQEPGGAIAMPVSGLRFEPRVDVQGRNLAEAQADIALRGGVFENTGFKIGGASLYDPQTGHYFAEIPVAPSMLASPEILTGWRNSLDGFNAGVGTIAYGWRPIETRGELSVGAGDHAYRRAGFYQGYARTLQNGLVAAADIEASRSESDGAVAFGDHEFERLAGRMQLRTARTQTDFFGGYQSKFFGWPNLYTPFGFNETENLQTVLALLNHRWTDGAGNFVQATAHYRRNKDDYEFNRAVPGASNPFQHTTWTRGASLEGRRQFGGAALNFSAQAVRDELASTALTAGRFNERSMHKVSMVAEKGWSMRSGEFVTHAGLTYDDSNRDSARVSPLVMFELKDSAARRWRLEYSETTQLPTYTALNSSATAGLFRGNPDLNRANSRNLEAGFEGDLGGWKVTAAIFHRWDDDLVDWTFLRGVTARTANAVDIATTGAELIATRRLATWDFVFGYTWLAKDANYGAASVDASFYALNFPRHRVTAAVTWRFAKGWELRGDNELRIQEENFLRTSGGDEAVNSSLGLYFYPQRWRGLEVSVLVDNLWDSEFQEVPAVPAAGRQVSLGLVKRW